MVRAGGHSMATMKSWRMTLTSPIIFYFTNTFMVITAGGSERLIKPGGPDLLQNFYSQENNEEVGYNSGTWSISGNVSDNALTANYVYSSKDYIYNSGIFRLSIAKKINLRSF